MDPIDRINQLNAEVGTLTRGNVLLREINRKHELRCSELATDALAASEAHAAANRLLSLERDSNALLRSQLHDAQEQAARDSQTIARITAQKECLDKRLEEFRIKLAGLADYCHEAVRECCLKNGGAWNWGSLPIEQVRDFLSRHA